jgi:hypothetical protein
MYLLFPLILLVVAVVVVVVTALFTWKVIWPMLFEESGRVARRAGRDWERGRREAQAPTQATPAGGGPAESDAEALRRLRP